MKLKYRRKNTKMEEKVLMIIRNATYLDLFSRRESDST